MFRERTLPLNRNIQNDVTLVWFEVLGCEVLLHHISEQNNVQDNSDLKKNPNSDTGTLLIN
jgi:hypothetical protein